MRISHHNVIVFCVPLVYRQGCFYCYCRDDGSADDYIGTCYVNLKEISDPNGMYVYRITPDRNQFIIPM